MAYTISSARLDFLKSSAQALFPDSPSTASYLLASHNRLLTDQSKTLTASQVRELCPACGSLRVPGWSVAVSTERKRKRNTRAGSKEPISTPRSGVVYKCLRCDRHVIQTLQKPPRHVHIQSKKTPSSSSVPEAVPAPANPTAPLQPQPKPADMSNATKPSENVSSKKRAKFRKNQGLLASLAASKQQSRTQTPSTSLDLLDFLQP